MRCSSSSVVCCGAGGGALPELVVRPAEEEETPNGVNATCLGGADMEVEATNGFCRLSRSMSSEAFGVPLTFGSLRVGEACRVLACNSAMRRAFSSALAAIWDCQAHFSM